MNIVLATGIYPPAIGGPASYVRSLAAELVQRGMHVTVVSYGDVTASDAWRVVGVSQSGTVLVRWWRYARALRMYAKDADVVYAFSSVSVGVPLLLARLPRRVRRVLRLGGDFGWERATDAGCRLGLREWYANGGMRMRLWRIVSQRILRGFHHVVFSSVFQQEIYAQSYAYLPPHSVVENAFPSAQPVHHALHRPLRLLSFGRQVAFKNLPALIEALELLPDATLTIAGDGPMHRLLRDTAHRTGHAERIRFLGVQHGADKERLFGEHDLLVVPSLTDISPNAALEARAAGLPVLLTAQTGLSSLLTQGMQIAPLRSHREIVDAVAAVQARYDALAAAACEALPRRGWPEVAAEHIALFQRIIDA